MSVVTEPTTVVADGLRKVADFIETHGDNMTVEFWQDAALLFDYCKDQERVNHWAEAFAATGGRVWVREHERTGETSIRCMFGPVEAYVLFPKTLDLPEGITG